MGIHRVQGLGLPKSRFPEVPIHEDYSILESILGSF